MLEAILAIVAALVSWYARKRIKRLEDEKANYLEALCEIDLAVATGNQNKVNARLDSVLRRLQHAESAGNSGRQESDTPAGG